MEEERVVGFNILPEGCISNILSLTNPRDACRSSLVSSLFKSASDSDVVWEKFLPLDYEEIISRSVSPSNVTFSSKKELYFHLCDHPILIDGGNKKYWVDRETGHNCFMLFARAMCIIWVDDPRYWRWLDITETSGDVISVAKLLNVCWLEAKVNFDISNLSPETIYEISFEVMIEERSFGLDFDVIFAIQQPSGVRNEHRQNLSELTRSEWQEIIIGEFETSNDPYGVMEVFLIGYNTPQWKRGLVIEVKVGQWKFGLIIEGE